VVSPELRGLHAAAGFVEKPSARVAAEATRRNGLWNTFVMTGHVGAFWAAARDCVPAMTARFDRLVDAIDTPDEAAVLAAIYEDMPAASFSRAVLERSAARCLLARLDGIEWSDWGSADRIEATLARRGPLAVGTSPGVTPIANAPGAQAAPGPA
jgi:mannose-1-phosphate guanylyltransferase